MRVEVTLMRTRGVAVGQSRIRDAPSARGDLMVGQESCPALNRTADVAHLKGNGPKDDDPLPPLLDCRLSWMSTGGFVLSGIAAEGDALYAQSWWCRPL